MPKIIAALIATHRFRKHSHVAGFIFLCSILLRVTVPCISGMLLSAEYHGLRNLQRLYAVTVITGNGALRCLNSIAAQSITIRDGI